MTTPKRTARVILAALVLLILLLPGCVNPDTGSRIADDPFFRKPFDYPEEPEALEYTYIRIGQEQRSGPGPTYEGSLVFHNCIHNPNPFNVQMRAGWNIYQVMGPPNDGELRLVNYAPGLNDTFYANVTGDPIAPYHHVYVNETLEGNSSDYAIHLWHEILVGPDEAVHRVDRWFNMTFTPYGPASTTHREGTPCSIGEEDPPAARMDVLP